jgi:hypothetical protein
MHNAAGMPDRRTIFTIAALAGVDPRTVAAYLDGRRVMPASARVIDQAIASLPADSAPVVDSRASLPRVRA